MGETKSIVTMHCGATLKAKESAENLRRHFAEIAAENRRRPDDMVLVVYDDEGNQRPQLDGKNAPCRFGCPCKRQAKRKEEVCWPTIDDGKRPSRIVISCRILDISAAKRGEG